MSEQKQKPSIWDKPEKITAVCALIVSVCALAVSLYEINLNRKQQKIMAWPHLIGGSSFIRSQGFRFLVQNNGLGPARIDHFEIHYKDKRFTEWEPLFEEMFGTVDFSFYSTTASSKVVLSGKELVLVQVFEDGLYDKLYKEWRNIEYRICYSSVYDDHWSWDGKEIVKLNRPCR